MHDFDIQFGYRTAEPLRSLFKGAFQGAGFESFHASAFSAFFFSRILLIINCCSTEKILLVSQ